MWITADAVFCLDPENLSEAEFTSKGWYVHRRKCQDRVNSPAVAWLLLTAFSQVSSENSEQKVEQKDVRNGQCVKERCKNELKAVDKAGKRLREAQLQRCMEVTAAWSTGAGLHLELSVIHLVLLLRYAECKNNEVM